MKFEQIEEAYSNYEAIEPYLTNEQKMHYLKAFQELIKLFKLNISLEDMAETM